MGKYFANLRMDWIAEMLNIYGFVQREHVARKFDISPQQATKDFRLFIEQNPGAMSYDIKHRCYVALNTKASDFVRLTEDRATLSKGQTT